MLLGDLWPPSLRAISSVPNITAAAAATAAAVATVAATALNDRGS
jgi:hypothetical protein